MTGTYDPLFDSAPQDRNLLALMHEVPFERANRIEGERDSARRIAVALEQECAAKDARIAEALNYLADALIWCNDGYSNTADCISEAIAALMGDDQ